MIKMVYSQPYIVIGTVITADELKAIGFQYDEDGDIMVEQVKTKYLKNTTTCPQLFSFACCSESADTANKKSHDEHSLVSFFRRFNFIPIYNHRLTQPTRFLKKPPIVVELALNQL